VNVFLYANNGTLPGSQLFAQRDIAATGFPDYALPLSGAPALPPGTYWLSVQEHAPLAPNGQWFWKDSVQHGNPGAWQNPGGGFGIGCTAWSVRKVCITTDAANPEQAFKLLGSTAVYPPKLPPSNAITLGKPKLNKKKGTAIEPVTVPGPGVLALSGKNVIPQRPANTSAASRTVTAAGIVNLPIKPKGKLKKKLKRTGKAKVSLTITYTPTGGSANAQATAIKLKKKLP